MICVVCGAELPPPGARESARVRSNVRKFREETFGVARCPGCRSLHAEEEVDLPHYYAGYPIFAATLDWKLDVVFGSMLKRLREGGLEDGARVLDYGAGSGVFVRYLASKGFDAAGYDAYAEGYRAPAVLEREYDCVVSQDVIEHVGDPGEFLGKLRGLVRPGGLLSIGTPDAAAIDLARASDFIHTLHLPFHRHILAADALRRLAEARGLETVRFYPTMYNNTLVPTMNPRFVLHYVRANDDCFDLITEPIQAPLRLFTPMTLFYALFGYFFDRHTDVQFLFRRPG